MRLNKLRITIGSGQGEIGLEFDRDYGSELRTGWSWTWGGSVMEQFQPLYKILIDILRKIKNSSNNN
jgi:hypothetical protein